MISNIISNSSSHVGVVLCSNYSVIRNPTKTWRDSTNTGKTKDVSTTFRYFWNAFTVTAIAQLRHVMVRLYTTHHRHFPPSDTRHATHCAVLYSLPTICIYLWSWFTTVITKYGILYRAIQNRNIQGRQLHLWWTESCGIRRYVKTNKQRIDDTNRKTLITWGNETWQITKSREKILLPTEMDFWRSTGKSRRERRRNNTIQPS